MYRYMRPSDVVACMVARRYIPSVITAEPTMGNTL